MQQVVFILLVYFTLLNLCFSSYLFYCSPYYVIFAYLVFCHFRYFIAICIVFYAVFPLLIFLYSLFQLYFLTPILSWFTCHSHTHYTLFPWFYVCILFLYLSLFYYVYFIHFRTAALIQAINSLSERGIKYCIITIIISSKL